ncbi:hypothetical protein [Rossellomorea sp. BNER]|uniref:hypothetical protein n=1 Tax=Rossellomorea sp. BNER TaxID=2962031 RepID=UPI003AF29126|nr:hypothetical protein [Rossellomorea sp. BNER]
MKFHYRKLHIDTVRNSSFVKNGDNFSFNHKDHSMVNEGLGRMIGSHHYQSNNKTVVWDEKANKNGNGE